MDAPSIHRIRAALRNIPGAIRFDPLPKDVGQGIDPAIEVARLLPNEESTEKLGIYIPEADEGISEAPVCIFEVPPALTDADVKNQLGSDFEQRLKRPIKQPIVRSNPMERKKATDFSRELLNLFDQYVHGGIDRRQFLDSAQKFAVGGITAAALFEMLKPNYAWAIQVQKDDPRIIVESTTVSSPLGTGNIKGTLVRPAKALGKLPTVLVIHENRGLNPYIEDVARRLAVANFIAFAPDGLTSVGGYPGEDEKGLALFRGIDGAKMREDFLAAAKWLKSHPNGTGKLGSVGFCFGGSVTNFLAVRMASDLDAAVPFYGGQPTPDEAAKIKAPLLAHYGELDTRITTGWPAFDAALTAAHVTHEGYVYPGANHGFHNDTTPRYDEAAAKLAWQRTLGWFNKFLR